MLKSPEFEYLNRRRDPANGLDTERLDFDKLFCSSVGFFRYQDAPWISQLLHATGQVHICARSIIRLVNSVLYRLNNNFTGVNANADLQIWIAEARNTILHCQRREAATDCVILVRLWGAKQGHYAVAL